MDLNYLKKLIKMLDSSELSEIEIEEEGTKIRLSKPKPKIVNLPSMQIPVVQPLQESITGLPVQAKEEKKEPVVETKQENYYEVKAPMVGTYYSSPSPDSDPYVKVGDTVKSGSVLCIIEAMKLMNEIESEVTGKIVKIMVENAQAVEYNQTLFLIDLAK